MSTLTARLVEAAVAGYDPEHARRAGGRALFDHLACRTAGRRVVPVEIGAGGASAALDRDDVHWASLTHPGSVVWPVLEAVGAEGDTRWRAAHAGYEVTARLGEALGAEHRRHWQPTATAGLVGGAVAAAVATGADPAVAAGHAVSLTGGSILCVIERTGTRLVQRDHTVAAALRCAEGAGVPATPDGLEHPRGLFAAMGGDPELLTAPRERAALSDVRFRRHATSGYLQAVVEAAAELAPVQAPRSVTVELPSPGVVLTDDPTPRTLEDAWWSAQHAVATTLLGLDLETGDDERVRLLAARVQLREGPVSRVTVDGRSAARAAAGALDDADLIGKWRALNPDAEPPLELLG
jgi:2-methylcitrate dehydratase PrpD